MSVDMRRDRDYRESERRSYEQEKRYSRNSYQEDDPPVLAQAVMSVLEPDDSHVRKKIEESIENVESKEQLEKLMTFLRIGSNMMKLRSGKTYTRHFSMDEQHSTICQKNGKNFNKIMISEVKDVREGDGSQTFVKAKKKKMSWPKEFCFTIVYGQDYRTLDLVAENEEHRDAWVEGLRYLLRQLKQSSLLTQQEIWMKKMFREADKNGDGSLSLKEILDLLKHLSIPVSQDRAKQLFRAADTNCVQNKKGEDCLDEQEFYHFYQLITDRAEIAQLFDKYNYEGRYLDPGELRDFLEKEQKLVVDQVDCESLINKFEPCPDTKGRQMLSLDGFWTMINSEEMSILNPKCNKIYQNMEQPLSHYYINSSHNTYLVGDQLLGDSSVEAYIRALKRGCRCVELDCWDGDKGEPVIYHGRTFTSKIMFKDVITAITESAFDTSPFPVILSLENHCCVEQQQIMAKHLINIMGPMLYTEKFSKSKKSLPSPAEMHHKFILKGKKIAKSVPETCMEEQTEEEDDSDSESVNNNNNENLAKELSDLIVICQSASFKSFDHSWNNYTCAQMSSLAEGKATSYYNNDADSFVRHNKWQLSRIYPSGRRCGSSNFNPQPMWTCGCQIVALNQQTWDEAMHLNEGRFLDNGSCGYVLKPRCLREDDMMFNPRGALPRKWKKILTIKAISGFQLPKRNEKDRDLLDPYVRVDIIGLPADNANKKTDYISNNGFHPIWNETMMFEVLAPEFALVYFQVKDYDTSGRNETVAQYCLPFNSMQQGYRLIPLRTVAGQPIWGALLLVQILIH